MSAAIKRLSTIIRPHPHTHTPTTTPKESSKTESNPIDAPVAPETPVAAKDNNTSDPNNTNSTSAPAPTSETPATAPNMTEPPTTTTPAPAADATTSVEPPKEGQAIGVSEAEAPAPASGAATEDKSTEPAAGNTAIATTASDAQKKTESKHETTSVKERSRRTRDIGRDTIRRFSTILRPGNGSHVKEKEKDSVPPVPVPPKAQSESATAGEVKPADETPAPATTTAEVEPTPPAPVEKPSTTAESKPPKSTTAVKTKEKERPEKPKTANRRGSSFFSAARDVVRGPQKKDTSKSKPAAKAEAVVSATRPFKKGAAKGKHVVVITGASRGVGLEFVKQYAVQPNTFVIALSRTIDKAAEVKAIVNESAKSGHNVRPIRVDIGNPKSVASAVKEIVELTDGRIDLLIHAAGTKADSNLRMADIKSTELEEELRYNLVGPIALTNALLPYLKPFPPPPEPKTADDVATKPDASVEPKADVEVTKPEPNVADTNKDTPAVPEANTEGAPTVPAVEPTVAEPTAEGTSTEPAVESTPAAEPTTEPSGTAAASSGALPTEVPLKTEENKQADPVQQSEPPNAAVPSDPPVPAAVEPELAPKESAEVPPAAPTPIAFPSAPYVVFLAPADPIVNNHGVVPVGSGFVPAPRTLFSVSRSALQVVIAKYGMSLGRQAGVVGVERPGILDPHTTLTDADAVKGVLEFLPSVTINQSGQLLRV